MSYEHTPEKEILFAALRSCLPVLRSFTDAQVERALGSKNIQQDAETFVAYVSANLDLEYTDAPHTKIVLITAGIQQLQFIKEKLSFLPFKINAKAIVTNIDYLENWYSEAYPSGHREVFTNFKTVCI